MHFCREKGILSVYRRSDPLGRRLIFWTATVTLLPSHFSAACASKTLPHGYSWVSGVKLSSVQINRGVGRLEMSTSIQNMLSARCRSVLVKCRLSQPAVVLAAVSWSHLINPPPTGQKRPSKTFGRKISSCSFAAACTWAASFTHSHCITWCTSASASSFAFCISVAVSYFKEESSAAMPWRTVAFSRLSSAKHVK